MIRSTLIRYFLVIAAVFWCAILGAQVNTPESFTAQVRQMGYDIVPNAPILKKKIMRTQMSSILSILSEKPERSRLLKVFLLLHAPLLQGKKSTKFSFSD